MVNTSLQQQQRYDDKLSRLVSYIDKNMGYNNFIYGPKTSELSIPNSNRLRYFVGSDLWVKIVGDDDFTMILLTDKVSEFERNNPELADKLYNELIRVFEIPSLDIVRYVLN